MNKQKLNCLFILSVLLVLSVIYSANVFVSYHQKAAVVAMTNDVSQDNSDSSEENLNETSSHLFLQERPLFYLKPIKVVNANFSLLINRNLPEAYLQLNTPPPDFA